MKIIRHIGFLLLLLPMLVRGQDISIDPHQPLGISYCNKAFYIAPNFDMVASTAIAGMRISFTTGFISNEDELHLVGYSGPVKETWYSFQGYLELVGSSNINDYIEAIRKVQYMNMAKVPTKGDRTITFSLNDVDYLPETGHFYKFIGLSGISWSAANAAASSAASKYHGLQGYLATITSSVENAFIQLKTKGMGWIGASDAAVENDWRWVTGPEGLEDNGQGRLFWRGTGSDAALHPGQYGPVNGAYHNWNRYPSTTNGEPNNNGNEDYAHITFFPSNPAESLKWNDLPNSGTTGDYLPAGYLVEYGGMPNDPPVSLIASIALTVHSLSFNQNGPFTRCQGDTVWLNRADNSAAYLWRPSTGLSNPAISNPVAKPDVTTEYTVIASIGTCKDSAKYLININPAPVSELREVEDICIGQSVTLDPGSHVSYLWGSGETSRTITRSTNGFYRVTLTAPNKCQTKDSVQVVVHQYPKMDLSKLDSLFCGSLSGNLNISSDKGTYTLTNLTNSQHFQGTGVTVPAYGNYPFLAEITDPYGCSSDTALMLLFHKIPKVDLTIDETECYGYNLQATYVGDATVAVSRFTWVFGGDTISDKLGQNVEQIPLGVNQTKRDLVLHVTEDGCTGSNSLKDIHVIPDLKIAVKDSLQCQPVLFHFTATNTENVVKYEWDWGDGTKGTGKSSSHLYAKAGFYDVNLVVTTDKGCMNSATIEKMVYVAPIPDVGFSLSPTQCLPQGKDTLRYVGSANDKDKYYWDLSGFDPIEIVTSPGNTAGPFVFDLINKPNATLSLYVISQYGCRSTTSQLKIKRRPQFSFNATPKDGCAPLSVDFEAKVDDPVDQLNFQWEFGDGNTGSGATINNVYQLPNQTHNLLVKANSTVTGCADSILQTGYIVVHPNPVAAFSMDHEIVYNDMPTVSFFDQSSDAVNYFWDFGDHSHSRLKDPVHDYEVVGKRKVVQTVYNQYDCQDTISHTVLVAFNKIFAPNAFAPNAPQPIDRVFLLASEGIKKEGYHLTILSRWNDKVFECKDEIKGWDGRMSNGNFAPAGNYIWILECADFLDRPHRQSGIVTLVF